MLRTLSWLAVILLSAALPYGCSGCDPSEPPSGLPAGQCASAQDCPSEVCADGVCATEQSVACRDSAPDNARSEAAPVTIRWSAEGGWAEPADCPWACLPDFAQEQGRCIDSKRVDCRDAAPENAESIVEAVEVRYGDESGWRLPAVCAWACVEGFIDDGGRCVDRRLVDCDTSQVPVGCQPIVVQVEVRWDPDGGWEPAAACASDCPNSPPTVQAPARVQGQEGAPVLVEVHASDPDGGAVALEAEGLPEGASFDHAAATLRWTPTHRQAGEHTVRFVARDPHGASASTQTVLDIADVNGPPEVVGDGPPGVEPWQAWEYVVGVDDPDGDPVTFRLVEAPACMTLDPETGTLRWAPAPPQVGHHRVRVVVEDSAGNEAEHAFEVEVADPGDVTAPFVRLAAPRRVQAGGSVALLAFAVDDREVSSVRFLVDDVEVGSVQEPPYRLVWQAPDQAGRTLQLQVVASDGAGHTASASQAALLVAGADETAPAIRSLMAPPDVAPGAQVLAQALVDDDRAVASVRFEINGEALGEVEVPPYRVPLPVPADAAAGGELRLVAVAVDAAGNESAAEVVVRVVAEPAAGRPVVIGPARPERALPNTPLALSAAAVAPAGVAEVRFSVNGLEAGASYEAPYQVTLPLPPELGPGAPLLLEAEVLDLAGERVGRAPVCSQIDMPGTGVVVVAALAAETGQPLAGAELAVPGAADPLVGDPAGRVEGAAAEGQRWVSVQTAGRTPAWRRLALADGGRARLLDAQLVQRATAERIEPVVGADLALLGRDATRRVPPGALFQPTPLALTELPARGLPAPLPAGWSPALALDLSPQDLSLAAPLGLLLHGGLLPGLVPARWDPRQGAWLVMEARADAEGTRVALWQGGAVALVRPDDGLELPAPLPGDPLPAGPEVPPPAALVGALSADPPVLFLAPGAHSEVTLQVAEPAGSSSGALVQLELTEHYERADGGTLQLPPVRRDLLLYRQGEALGGSIAAGPSRSFDSLIVPRARIDVAAVLPSGSSLQALGPAGGELVGGGATLLIPAGALERAAPARLAAAPATGAPGADLSVVPIAALELELDDARLATGATLELPLPPDVPADAQTLLVHRVTVEDGTFVEATALGERDPGAHRLRFAPDAGGLPWPGVRAGGRYWVVYSTAPLAFATGELSAADDGLAEALVTSEPPRFAQRRTALPTPYVLPLDLAASAVGARRPGGPERARAEVHANERGAVVLADLTLAAARPTVVSVTPPDGAVQVSPATSVVLRVSAPVDPATLTAEAVTLASAAGPVPATLELLPDRRSVVLRPDDLLPEDTTLTLTATAALRDTFGGALAGPDPQQPDEPFRAQLRTLDDTPPEAPEPGQIEMSEPDADGHVIVTGTQGSAEPGTAVAVVNTATGETVTVLANEDGSFVAVVESDVTDDLRLILVDESGNVTEVDLGRAPPPEGQGVVGAEGGLVEGEGGVAVAIPPGVLPPDTVVRIAPVAPPDVLPSFMEPGQAQWAGAVSLDLGEAQIPRVVELVLSVDGYPEMTVLDRVPPFELQPVLSVPEGLAAGAVLHVRAVATDASGGRTVATAEVSVTAGPASAELTHLVQPGSPVVRLSLPATVRSGERRGVAVAAEAPALQLRLPATVELSGQEQILLFEEVERAAGVALEFVGTAHATEGPEGASVLQADANPLFRGITASASRVGALLVAGEPLGLLRVAASPLVLPAATRGSVLVPEPLELPQPVRFKLGGPGRGAGPGPGRAQVQAVLGLAPRRYLTPRYGLYEMAVAPVPANTPLRLTLYDAESNAALMTVPVAPVAPGELSAPLVLGEDGHTPVVAALQPGTTHALPVEAVVAVTFSHIVDPSTLTLDNIYLRDDAGTRVEATCEPRSYPTSPGQSARVQAVLTPKRPLRASGGYALVLSDRVCRPNDLPCLQTGGLEFRLRTAASGQRINSASIPSARAFDTLDDLGLVRIDQIRGRTGFAVVALDRIGPDGDAAVLATVDLDPALTGPVRSVAAVRHPTEGDLAIIGLGSPNHFGRLRYYHLRTPGGPVSPVQRNYTITGLSMQMLELCDEIYAADRSGGVADFALISPCAQGSVLRGIPRVPAIPGAIDAPEVLPPDGRTLWFVNNGVGVMSLRFDDALTIPGSDRLRRDQVFGPSFLPQEKAAAVVVVPETSPDPPPANAWVTITAPADKVVQVDAGAPYEAALVLEGTADPEVTALLVNGYAAQLTSAAGASGTSQTFVSAAIPLHPGINEVVATPLAGAQELPSVGLLAVVPFGPAHNPLRGSLDAYEADGSRRIFGGGRWDIELTSPPPLSVGAPNTSVMVQASLRSGASPARMDAIYVAGERIGKPAGCRPSDPCGWNGHAARAVDLHEGINVLHATAVDEDDPRPGGLGYTDLRVAGGVVVAVSVGGALEVFDARSLVRLAELDLGVGGGARLTLAEAVLVDLDADGRTGLQENEDDDGALDANPDVPDLADWDLNRDGRIEVFDERKSLALIGHGGSGLLTVADLTRPGRPRVLGRVQLSCDSTPGGAPASAWRGDVDAQRGLAYIAAGACVAVVDLLHAKGEPPPAGATDPRIVDRIVVPGGGVQDVHFDDDTRSLHVLQEGRGLHVVRLGGACPHSVSVDLNAEPRQTPLIADAPYEQTLELLDTIETVLAGAGLHLNVEVGLLDLSSSGRRWEAPWVYAGPEQELRFALVYPSDDPTVAGRAAQAATELEEVLEDQRGWLGDRPQHNRHTAVEVEVIPVDALRAGWWAPSDDPSTATPDDPREFGIGRGTRLLEAAMAGRWVSDAQLRTPGTPPLYAEAELIQTLDALVQPMTPETDPAILTGVDPEFVESSHIVTVEAHEVALLAATAFEESGVRVRRLRAGSNPRTGPLHDPDFQRKLRRAAGAGLQALLARLLATPQGQEWLLVSEALDPLRGGSACYTRRSTVVDGFEALAGLSVATDLQGEPCLDFAQIVASKVAEAVAEDRPVPHLDAAHGPLAYRLLHVLQQRAPMVRSEAEAGPLVAEVLWLLDSTLTITGPLWRDLRLQLVDSALRADALDALGERRAAFRPEEGAAELELRFPATVRNEGTVTEAGATLACSLDGAADPYVDPTPLGVLEPGAARRVERDEEGVYPLALPLAGVAVGEVFGVRCHVVPEGEAPEPDLADNHDGFYFYLLPAQRPFAPPDVPPESPDGDRPPRAASGPAEEFTEQCREPSGGPPSRVELRAELRGMRRWEAGGPVTGPEQRALTVEPTEAFSLAVYVTNTGTEPLDSVRVRIPFGAGCDIDETFAGPLLVGQSTGYRLDCEAPSEQGAQALHATVAGEVALDTGLATAITVDTAPVTRQLPVHVVPGCEAVLEDLHPRLNPATSKLMREAVAFRHYRLADPRTGAAVPNEEVEVVVTLPDGTTRTMAGFRTNAEGLVYGDAPTVDGDVVSTAGLPMVWQQHDLWMLPLLRDATPDAARDQLIHVPLEAEVRVPGIGCVRPRRFELELQELQFKRGYAFGVGMEVGGGVKKIAELNGKVGAGVSYGFAEQTTHGGTYGQRSIVATFTSSATAGVELTTDLRKRKGGEFESRALSVSAGASMAATRTRVYRFPYQAGVLRQRDAAALAAAATAHGSWVWVNPLREYQLWAAQERLPAHDIRLEDYLQSEGASGAFALSGGGGFKGVMRTEHPGEPKKEKEYAVQLGAQAQGSSTLELQEVKLPKAAKAASWTTAASFGASLSLPDYIGSPIQGYLNQWLGMASLRAQTATWGVELDPGDGYRPVKIGLGLDGVRTTDPNLVGAAQQRGIITVELTDGRAIDEVIGASGNVKALAELAPETGTLAAIGAAANVLRFGFDPINSDAGELDTILRTKPASVSTEEVSTASFSPLLPLQIIPGLKIPLSPEVTCEASVSYTSEEAVVREGATYPLHRVPRPVARDSLPEPDPTLQQLVDTEDTAQRALWDLVRPEFEQHEAAVGAAPTTLSTSGATELLIGPGSGADQVGIISFAVRDDSSLPAKVELGPWAVEVPPSRRSRYGVGGFHLLAANDEALSEALAEPAQLTIRLDANERAEWETDELATYRWDQTAEDWELVGGEPTAADDGLVADIDRLGLYTLAPAMPAGVIAAPALLLPPAPAPGGGGPGEPVTLLFGAALPARNNGTAVPDGSLFLVQARQPWASEPGPLCNTGAGLEVASSNGALEFSLICPADVGDLRVILSSQQGTAYGQSVVSVDAGAGEGGQR